MKLGLIVGLQQSLAERKELKRGPSFACVLEFQRRTTMAENLGVSRQLSARNPRGAPTNPQVARESERGGGKK